MFGTSGSEKIISTESLSQMIYISEDVVWGPHVFTWGFVYMYQKALT